MLFLEHGLWLPWDPTSPAHTGNRLLGPLARELWGRRLGLSGAPRNKDTMAWLQKGSPRRAGEQDTGTEGPAWRGGGQRGHGLSCLC